MTDEKKPATIVKGPPKDIEQRNAKREELRAQMQTSLQEQGTFGTEQTKRWLKVYKRAARSIAREVPSTPASQQKLITELRNVCKPWVNGRPAA